MITTAFILLCALWRPWLGGLFPIGTTALTWPKYGVGMALVGGFTSLAGMTWWASLLYGLAFLTVWRISPHGPLLKVPLGNKEKGKDPILDLLGGPNGTVLQWWIYAGLRYSVLLGLWAYGATWLDQPWLPLAAAAVLIPMWYFLTETHPLIDDLPYGITMAVGSNGPQPCHFAEFLSGATLGAAIALTVG